MFWLIHTEQKDKFSKIKRSFVLNKLIRKDWISIIKKSCIILLLGAENHYSVYTKFTFVMFRSVHVNLFFVWLITQV